MAGQKTGVWLVFERLVSRHLVKEACHFDDGWLHVYEVTEHVHIQDGLAMHRSQRGKHTVCHYCVKW
jgi:hypothetical protein